MADSSTVARPYAKAVFELALEGKSVSLWSTFLGCLSEMMSDTQAKTFVMNPSTTPLQQRDLLFSVLDQVCPVKTQCEQLRNFLYLLAENKRLMVLSSICEQFNHLRADHEKTLVVDVITFAPLTAEQEQSMIKRLGERLQRQITLNIQIDKTLQGGAIIRADHLVIDGSVATKIKKLSGNLAA